MKSGPIFLLGLFIALVVSFGGIVLGSNVQLGRLTPYFDESDGQSYPLRPAGLAMRGQLVYADLGCVVCHTQQVRRPDFGSDQARGWGERQSVARDYIHQIRPQLGASRYGPDLANFGGRKKTDDEVYQLLLDGAQAHPSYGFLFDARKGPRESAAGVVAVRDGQELVPSERARTLVAYLQSLNTGYDYPESRPVAPPPKGAAHGPAPGKSEVKPVSTAAPVEKKHGEAKK